MTIIGRTGTTILLALAAAAACAEPAPEKVTKLAENLATLGKDPVITRAVSAQNALGRTLDAIKADDAEWQATAGLSPKMTALIESACGKQLGVWQESRAYLAEVFVMDNQGANVCMTDKTSDYWQGDEAKFTESYKGGAGAIHIGDVKFDDSSQTYVAQVSVPVVADGQVVGAITFGIDVDKI